MKGYFVPLVLSGLFVFSVVFLLYERISAGNLNVVMARRSISELPLSPPDQKKFKAILAQISQDVQDCMGHSDSNGQCREDHAINLVRTLKISDKLFPKLKGFRTTPYLYWKHQISPESKIVDLRCRLEEKKPVCKVVRA